ncbi:hypothetical protein V7101_20935, partial [Bacillus velezensis]|uniref:hypothetical protein n=1 Tax=Bacillus velezensis TaxID=492670 RepID=UPI002FFDCF1E
DDETLESENFLPAIEDLIDEKIRQIDYPVDSVNGKKDTVILTAEDVRAETPEGAHEKDAQVLEDAKVYTDEKFSQATSPVTSVNNKVGDVVLNADDVGAETPENAQVKANEAEANANQYTDSKVDERVSKSGDTMTGHLQFDTSQSEKRIRTMKTGLDGYEHGISLNSNGFNLYDWRNARNVLGYSIAGNLLNITSGNVNLSGNIQVNGVEVETVTGAKVKADTAEQNAINFAQSFGLGTNIVAGSETNLDYATNGGLLSTTATADHQPENFGPGRLIVIPGNQGNFVQVLFSTTNNTACWRFKNNPWNFFETVAGAQERIEETSYSIIKSNKYALGKFQKIEKKRTFDNSLAIREELSGPGPNYPVKTITYFRSDGTSIKKIEVYDLVYDIDNDLVSNMIREITYFADDNEEVGGSDIDGQ